MTTTRQGKLYTDRRHRPSRWGWAFLLLAVMVAAGFRFWQLGQIPPGLYRDEAQNGLDALDVLSGDREGQSLFYFAANNGREPAYIYLTAVAVALVGSTPVAVRLAAAVVGTLTTWFVYKLADSWFGRHVGGQIIGVLAAWLWAITVWPIHLSRVGLRPILLPLMLALTLWLGTLAYRRQQRNQPSVWLWFATGAVYGAAFYTYLAVRFTPVFFAIFLVYLVLTGRQKAIWPAVAWSMLGTALVLLPLAWLAWQQPELILGRLNQVSAFDPVVNQGNLLATLLRNFRQAMGLFLIEGDDILRHNPAGRPFFDLFMAVPFVMGLIWCLRRWREPASMALLLWIVVMLGPTILAEDTPHFLRAAGILPAAIILPAIGLSVIWSWRRLSIRWRQTLVIVLVIASTFMTIKDYFYDYGRDPQTAYWFEAAARGLAEQMNGEPVDSTIFADRRFWDGWPSISFLLEPGKHLFWYRPDEMESVEIDLPAVIYAWPHAGLNQVMDEITRPAQVSGKMGSLAQGDLDPEPYPLYIRYEISESPVLPILANMDNTLQLRDVSVEGIGTDSLTVDLFWSTALGTDQSLVTFVHVSDPEELIAQSDHLPGNGYWDDIWHRPGLIIHDRHDIELKETFGDNKLKLEIGVYNANTLEPLPIIDLRGNSVGNTWLWQPSARGNG